MQASMLGKSLTISGETADFDDLIFALCEGLNALRYVQYLKGWSMYCTDEIFLVNWTLKSSNFWEGVSPMRKLTTLCTLSIVCVLSTSSFAQSFYKWVDEKGSTHYSDTVPTHRAKNAKKVQTINDTPSGTATPVNHTNTPSNNAEKNSTQQPQNNAKNNPTQPAPDESQNTTERTAPAAAEHNPRAQ